MAKEPVIRLGIISLVAFCMAALSFYFYGPANPLFFNSDQAIHVLMAIDFNWPADAYYWGQNRLGSLLPLLSLPFISLKITHPILVLGILNHGFLLAGFLLIQKHLPSWEAKIFFLFALFFPHPTYHYQLLMGHPYAAQFFTVAASVWFYLKWVNHFEVRGQAWNFIAYLLAFFAFFFALVSVWVSELSLMLLVAYACHLFTTHWWKKSYPILFAIICVVLGVWLLSDLKRVASPDANYHQVFIGSAQEIKQQWFYFYEQLQDVILIAKHHSSFQCYYYYFLVFSMLFMLYNKRKFDLLLGIILATSILLFFSKWNLRSNFDPKYFTPVMLLSMFWIAKQLSAFRFSQKWFLVAGLVVSLGVSTVDFILSTRNSESTFEQYAGIENVPNGLVFGTYWEVYRLSAVSEGKVVGVSINDWDFRNKKNRQQLTQYSQAYLTSEALQMLDTANLRIHDFELKLNGKIYAVGSQQLHGATVLNHKVF